MYVCVYVCTLPRSLVKLMRLFFLSTYSAHTHLHIYQQKYSNAQTITEAIITTDSKVRPDYPHYHSS